MFSKNRIVSGLAIASALASGACTSPTGPGTSNGALTLSLMRNGKPAVGVITILQDESTGADIGSGTSDANGKISTQAFTGNARATFEDGNATSNFLLTLEDLPSNSSLTVNLPLVFPKAIGSISYHTPAVFAGADGYNIYVLTSANQTADFISTPVAGAVRTLTVNDDSVQTNGTLTVVAVAQSGATPVAYSILSGASYAPTGQTPSPLSFGAWQTNLQPANLSVSALPAGFAPTNGQAQLFQMVKNVFLDLSAFSSPSSLTTTPLDYSMVYFPGLSDEFKMEGQFSGGAGGTAIGFVRQMQYAPALSSWNPAANTGPMLSDIQLSASSQAGAPAFTWKQTAAGSGNAAAALVATEWTVGGVTYYWYVVTDPSNIDTTYSYAFPKLPATYGAYVPPSGATLSNATALYYTYVSGGPTNYSDFLSQDNLDVVTYSLPVGTSGEIDYTGVSGTP